MSDIIVLIDDGSTQYMSIFADDRDRFRIYLNSISPEILKNSLGFICYEPWMLEFIEEYIELRPEMRHFYIYGHSRNVKLGSRSSNVKNITIKDLDMVKEFEETQRESPLPADWPGRLDNILLRGLENEQTRILGYVKDGMLINYILMIYRFVETRNEKRKVWTIEEISDKACKNKGLALETLLEGIRFVKDNDEKIYIPLTKSPYTKGRKDFDFQALKNHIIKAGFVLCSEKFYRHIE